MRTLSLYQEYDLAVYETERWELPAHKHDFFEIIYVLEGTGIHVLNHNEYRYKKDSLFLLTPEDVHAFEVVEKSKFCIITFHKIYFSKTKNTQDKLIDFTDLFRKIEIIFYNANLMLGEPVLSKIDKQTTSQLIAQIIHETEHKSYFHEAIIQNSVFLLLNLIARNIQQNLSQYLKAENPKNDVGEILNYIQQNIYDKEKLRISVIAEHLFKSKNYISQYFKEHTGQSLKEYILKYKLNLIKSRLLHSNLTIMQIALELGFTDESHLNKTFKQEYGMTAKEFKKNNTST